MLETNHARVSGIVKDLYLKKDRFGFPVTYMILGSVEDKFPVVAFGDLAETSFQVLRKSDRIEVAGFFRAYSFRDCHGNERYEVKIVVSKIKNSDGKEYTHEIIKKPVPLPEVAKGEDAWAGELFNMRLKDFIIIEAEEFDLDPYQYFYDYFVMCRKCGWCTYVDAKKFRFWEYFEHTCVDTCDDSLICNPKSERETSKEEKDNDLAYRAEFSLEPR